MNTTTAVNNTSLNQLERARALTLPSRDEMLVRAPSVQQFWNENRELLSKAWAEWENSNKDHLLTPDESLLDEKLRHAVTQAWDTIRRPLAFRFSTKRALIHRFAFIPMRLQPL